MNNARLDFLFHRYRNATCTKEEELELMQLITDSNDPQVKNLLHELWNEAPEELLEEKADLILNTILERHENVVPFYKRLHLWARAAAVTALLVMSGVTFYHLGNSSMSSQSVASVPTFPQQNFLTLPDGSTVILNKLSKLDFNKSFGGKAVREVYLTGEAFFDISHNEEKPFIVHTGKISTTVLGTAFNVKAYPEQDNITVTVTRGKVSVSDEVKVLGVLAPDEQIVFHKKNASAKLLTVESEKAMGWIEKDIFFDDVTMADAIQQLQQRFNVKITFKNQRIEGCRFTATFIKGEDLYEILDVICEFNQAKYTTGSSGEIEISGDGC
jgi:ferric-dicitrate binding protein FerR (iron transport regulator)